MSQLVSKGGGIEGRNALAELHPSQIFPENYTDVDIARYPAHNTPQAALNSTLSLITSDRQDCG
jgi:hypothetical protein